MSRLRVAVCGAGNWGRNHVRTVASLPEAELVAVCDPDAKRLAQVARQYPAVQTTADLEETLDLAEAVVVAAPATHHATIATAAIERGLAVGQQHRLRSVVRGGNHEPGQPALGDHRHARAHAVCATAVEQHRAKPRRHVAAHQLRG